MISHTPIFHRSFLRSVSAAIISLLLAEPARAAALAADGASPLPATLSVDLGEGIAMEFVLVQPGSFLMGTSTHEPDEGPVRTVTITRPFYMGKYEVTQEQWLAVMESNPSHFAGANRPVENVSWNDCQRFLEAAKKKTGRMFSLPTEAQWEYACRAGSRTEFGWGDDADKLDEYAWYSANSELRTHPVGTRKPNAWGFYDMHGNVYEWCADWYSEGTYSKSEVVDPVGPAHGRRRVLRGGGWIFVSDNLRSADRGFSPPDLRTNEYGFRCVLLPEGDQATAAAIQASATTAEPPLAVEDSIAAQLTDAIAGGDRLRAEFLLADLANAAPGDDRLVEWRQRIALLPVPPASVVISLRDDVQMEFVLISPGRFSMGDEEAESMHEKPARLVTISRPFYMAKYEVTQRQWEAMMTRNDSAFTGDPERPVDTVNWHLAQSFLEKMNQSMTGFGFRLPTEAEWEYACRAGSSGPRHFTGEALSAYAWYGENSGGCTHAVGKKRPNAWGLYDMYGNVWEWCEDRFGGYASASVIDPTGPTLADIAGARVARGGAWNNLPKYINSTFRHDVQAAAMARYYGFRCVASLQLMDARQKP